MIRAFIRQWVGMLAMMVVIAIFALPTWALGTAVERLTDNVWVGFAVVIVANSLLIAALMTWWATPPGRRLIDWLARMLFDRPNKAA